jgi:hypothetical protein
MTLLYSKIKDEETKEYEVINQEEAKKLGWEQNDLEFAYNGKFYLKGCVPEKPAPTKEEQEKNREEAYSKEVDPITCHINRLKDEEQTPEIEAEIEELKQERAEKVEDIKARYPYPVE